MLKFIISSLFVNSIVSMPYNNLNNTTTTATCNWIGHCLGDFCQNENDCDNNWVCTDGVCSVDADAITPVTPVTATVPCNWIGHCLGNICQNENDCDNNWVCCDGVCSVDADAITPVTVPVTPCNDCDDDCNDCTVTPTTVPCNTQTPV